MVRASRQIFAFICTNWPAAQMIEFDVIRAADLLLLRRRRRPPTQMPSLSLSASCAITRAQARAKSYAREHRIGPPACVRFEWSAGTRRLVAGHESQMALGTSRVGANNILPPRWRAAHGRRTPPTDLGPRRAMNNQHQFAPNAWQWGRAISRAHRAQWAH